MNRINGKLKIALSVTPAVLIITGGAVTYGFQGILAALGLLFLLTSAGFGIFMVRKARLYAKALKYAEWKHNLEFTPVSTDDKKWIMKHLDEYVKVKEATLIPAETVITKKDREEIMSHLDEFLSETRIEQNTITTEDKTFILKNIVQLFEDNREEDRQTFTW